MMNQHKYEMKYEGYTEKKYGSRRVVYNYIFLHWFNHPEYKFTRRRKLDEV